MRDAARARASEEQASLDHPNGTPSSCPAGLRVASPPRVVSCRVVARPPHNLQVDEEFSKERRSIDIEHRRERQQLMEIINAVLAEEAERQAESKQEFDQMREEIRNKNLEDINVLRITLEVRSRDGRIGRTDSTYHSDRPPSHVGAAVSGAQQLGWVGGADPTHPPATHTPLFRSPMRLHWPTGAARLARILISPPPSPPVHSAS